MYAVIKTGGKQYRTAPGELLKVEKLSGDIGDTVVFDEVLLTSDDENITVGSPVVENAKVTGQILRHGKDRKIIIFKSKRRKGYRKKQGHRQSFTEVRIDEISANN